MRTECEKIPHARSVKEGVRNGYVCSVFGADQSRLNRDYPDRARCYAIGLDLAAPLVIIGDAIGLWLPQDHVQTRKYAGRRANHLKVIVAH